MAQSQRSSELANHFPIGAVLAMGATTALANRGGSATTATQCNNVAGLTEHLRNQVSGLIENNLKYALIYLGSPYFHEVQQDLLGALESNDQRGPLYAIFQPMGQRTSSAATGLTAEFTTNTAVANDRTVSDPLVSTVVANLGDHPSLLAYALDDDIQKSANADQAARNNTLTQAFQALDAYNRPASAMWRDRGYADLGLDCRYILTYEYPCGRTSGGVDTLEGDFHRSTFATITGTATPDWVDVIRHRIAYLPSGARHIWMLQCHYTNTGSAASRLRQPTDRELRKQFWTLVGEGCTGILFFPFTDFDPGGGAQPMLGARPSALAVARELSDRLKPNLRLRLLGCTAAGAATAFTTSGGGTSGLTTVDYASAYVGELTHTDRTKYVVVVNHSNSSANVTVSHPTSTGYLVSLETGTRYKLGTDAIPLGALDGTILRYDEQRGVPTKTIDRSIDVETWWSTHWANPSSSAYVSSANVKLHTNTVDVPAGASLQAYVDAAPDYTTFRLAAGGVYGEVQLVERSHLHFTSADPANKATIARVKVWGSQYAQQYNSVNTDYGYVAILYSNTTDASLTTGGANSIREQAKYRFLKQPSQDLIFDQINFAPDSQPIVYYRKFTIDTTYQTDHWYEGTPIAMRTVKDVLVQRCTISGYKWGSDNSSAPPNDPQQNNTGPVSHPGLIWGNAGIANIVVRDNTFTLATNAANTGSPSATFFDGAQGYVAYNNTISGKQNQDTFNFLINDDYTGDFRNPGTIDALDQRMSRYCVIASNSVTPTGSATLLSASGERLLVKGNTVNVGSGTIPVLINLDTKVCRLASGDQAARGFYRSYGTIIDGNAVTGNVTKWVELNTAVGYTPGLTSTHPFKSTVGQVTLKNNTATGTVARWWGIDAGSTLAADGPHILTSNAPLSRTAFTNQVMDALGSANVTFLYAALGTDTTTSTTLDTNARTITWDGSVASRLSAQGAMYLQSFTSASSQDGSTPNTLSLSFGNGVTDTPFSVVALANMTDTVANRTIISKYNGGGGGREWIFTVTGSDRLMLLLDDNSVPVDVNAASNAAIAQGAPHLYAATYDGRGGATAASGIVLYQDGAVIASTATNSGTYVAMEHGTEPVYIGSVIGHTAQFFSGSMGFVAICTTVLTATQLRDLVTIANQWYALSLT